ncbi:MAG: PIN domain-containing protein [Thermomicrobiales bacterium]
MSRYLLDVNVLIALIDVDHAMFERAGSWFHADPALDWLICPIVQMGVVRIMSGPRYSSPLRPAEAMESLRSVTCLGGCRFVADDLDVLDRVAFDDRSMRGSAHITDTYLLALAAHHGAALATFDARIGTNAVRSSDAEVFLIP